ncbi:hypothetical protein J5N97_008092 [Dioscorea zingiberensis]|uniref:Chlorophyll a-b binding protein, chloroplastic n=1 Tax=Dioscorea zingiberensis TaxID=325984 RepID=A0A9D5DD73_9LILI|nr:hypothetical protein J5N97_008092 [Dioscorea zingiberensis]
MISKEKIYTQLWFASKQSLSYLDGSLPGDNGFDPLGLSVPEGTRGFIELKWLPYGEVINGRFAMLGAFGAIAPEIFGKLGLIPPENALPWFKTGDTACRNLYIAIGQTLILCLYLGGFGDPAYPGGPLSNPLGSMKELKLKEIKNGRLAMLAILGYFIQGLVTGEGPFQNLLDHLADPINNNVLTSLKFH